MKQKQFSQFWILVLHLCLAGAASAQDLSAKPQSGAEREIHFLNPPEKILFGQQLQIEVSGEVLKSIQDEMTKSNSSADKVVQFYFDGVRMYDLPCDLHKSAQSYILSVVVDRDANHAESRQAWDNVLWRVDEDRFAHKVSVTLGVANRTPIYIGDIVVAVNTTTVIFWVGFFSIGGFWAILIWCIKKTDMLRDGGTGTAYSLGKTQMAFWGLIVIFCFVGVWATSRKMERIPSQVLILLGISGSTGLAALVVGNSKQEEAAQSLKVAQKEQANLLAIPTASLTPEQALRLTLLPTEIATHSKNACPLPSSGSFWRDICTDAHGMSFHRLQIVIWTLILGGIFAHSVFLTLSMPEFSETLLTLLGISNGTYLGFKIPEK